MAEIFISYASTDRELAEWLANRLRCLGFTVWWDSSLTGGVSFRKVILGELAEAKAVIVIWTHNSIESDWVHDEASRAHRYRKLIPLRVPILEPTEIHPPFGALHTLLLQDERGLVKSLARLGLKIWAREGSEEQKSNAAASVTILSPTDAAAVRCSMNATGDMALRLGDQVNAGHKIVELDVMGQTLSLTAPRSGIITDIMFKEEQEAKRGQPLVILSDRWPGTRATPTFEIIAMNRGEIRWAEGIHIGARIEKGAPLFYLEYEILGPETDTVKTGHWVYAEHSGRIDQILFKDRDPVEIFQAVLILQADVRCVD